MSPVKANLLFTGSAGYIRTDEVKGLKKSYKLIALDNLSYRLPDLLKDVFKAKFVIVSTREIAALWQFATFIAVGESVHNLRIYDPLQVVGTLTIKEAMVAAPMKNLAFSATFAI